MTAPAYDDSNVFAKILRGEMPSHKLYEDDATIAFMDVMPSADGHCLVIPKAPSRNMLDADPESLMRLVTIVQKLARAVKRRSKPTASPSSSSTRRRAASRCSTCISTSSRASRAWR